MDAAAAVATLAVRDVLLAGSPLTLVRWVLWSDGDLETYRRALDEA